MNLLCKDHHKIPIKNSGINYITIDQQENNRVCNLWRIMTLIMMGFFIMAAIVQYNDPDPYVWIPIYSIPAIFAGVSAIFEKITRNRIFVAAVSLYIVCVFSYALFLVIINGSTLIRENVNVLSLEEGREISGLLIVLAWCVLQLWYGANVSEESKQKYFITKKIIIASITISLVSLIPPILWGLCHITNIKEHLKYCNEICY